MYIFLIILNKLVCVVTTTVTTVLSNSKNQIIQKRVLRFLVKLEPYEVCRLRNN